MYLTYLRRELRRRSKQAIVVAVGLAVGIGLVMIVSATSAGVKTAQAEVLHSLYGVGTDMTVTKTASPGSGAFAFRTGAPSGSRPAAGTHVSSDRLRAGFGTGVFTEGYVGKVASIRGVAAATGGLTLTDTKFSGTIPNFGGGFFGGGSSGSTGFRPSFQISNVSVDGIEVSSTGVGPLTSNEIASGRFFGTSENDANVAVVSASYATEEKLKVGSTVTIAGKQLPVVGVADVDSSSAQVFIPLGTAQRLAGLTGDVTTIFVSAASSADVSSIAAAAQTAVPGSTVTTAADLAKEVTGSITNASNLATSLGKWLSIAALVVAFLIAGLLMMAAVSRRVREFGTLKAIGWRTRRIVGQVMGEGVALGLGGGIIGLGLGLGGSAIVSAVAPSLSATVGSTFATSGGGGGFGGGGFGGGGGGFGGGTFPARTGAGPSFGRGGLAAAHTVLVHLTAPIQGGTVLLAILLAVAGGLVAGAFGSWRAARLRPAAALRRIE